MGKMYKFYRRSIEFIILEKLLFFFLFPAYTIKNSWDEFALTGTKIEVGMYSYCWMENFFPFFVFPSMYENKKWKWTKMVSRDEKIWFKIRLPLLSSINRAGYVFESSSKNYFELKEIHWEWYFTHLKSSVVKFADTRLVCVGTFKFSNRCE